jgi:hypothetical protein
LPDPSSTNNPEFQLVLTLLRWGLKAEPWPAYVGDIPETSSVVLSTDAASLSIVPHMCSRRCYIFSAIWRL